MDDSDDGPLELVPPSPIASSTQLPRPLGHNVPPLPQLFLVGSSVAEESGSDLSTIATSTQQPESSRSLLSPIATSTQQHGSSRSLLSPVAASTQQPRSLTLVSPIATSRQQQPGPSRYIFVLVCEERR